MKVCEGRKFMIKTDGIAALRIPGSSVRLDLVREILILRQIPMPLILQKLEHCQRQKNIISLSWN